MQSKLTLTLAPYGSKKSIAIASKVGDIGKVGKPALNQRQVVRRKKTK